jgi:hypothetical protein
MYRFSDHLAKGKTAGAFFAALGAPIPDARPTKEQGRN